MPPLDKFSAYADSPESAPTDAEAITPTDDVTDLPFVTRFIRAAEGGIVMAVPFDKRGTNTAVPMPISDHGLIMGKFTRILATGTTATGIVIQN